MKKVLSESPNRIEIWQGDCLTLMKDIPDKSVDFVITSPPYNQGKSIKHRSDIYKEYKDNLSDKEYMDFLSNVLDELLRITKQQVFFNIQYNSQNKIPLFRLIGKYAERIKDILIWSKPYYPPAVNSNVLSHNYEFIIVLDENSGRTYKKDFGKEGRKTTSFIELNNDFMNPRRFECEDNFAIMPINLVERIFNTFTEKTDLILDPFMGSGTTLVAAVNLNRNAIGIEISPKYCQIAEERIKATLNQKKLF